MGRKNSNNFLAHLKSSPHSSFLNLLTDTSTAYFKLPCPTSCIVYALSSEEEEECCTNR